MKKIIFTLAFVLLQFLGYAQYTAIPDSNFEQALFDQGIDSVNGDHQVLTSAISGLVELNIPFSNISNLTGIEGFTSLQYLYCMGNSLSSLNVSANTALKSLSCDNNSLSSLNVSTNAALTSLSCSSNSLSSLNVSANAALTFLSCDNNPLSSLNVSANTALAYLSCNNNTLSSLNVSTNTALDTLICYNNLLSSLDVSANTALMELICFNNSLSSLNLSTNTALIYFNCTSNPNLTCITVADPVASAANTNWNKDSSTNYSTNCGVQSGDYTAIPDSNFEQALYNLGIDTINSDHQVLTSAISGVTSLDVQNLNIYDLTGIEGFVSLQSLNCRDNQLTNLNLSGLTALTYLECHGNYLTSLNLNGLTSLNYLSCGTNQLTSLDLTGITALTYFDYGSNHLTSLNLAGMTSLNDLRCYGNQLTDLNLNGLTALNHLECTDNQLTSLDVIGLTSLNYLNCFANQLTNLNVSGLTNLQFLHCTYNQLTSLNVSGATALQYLSCYANPTLTCITVSNVTDYIGRSWDKDPTANYSTNCGASSTGSTAAVLSGSTAICSGNSATISVDITGGTSPYTVVYSNGNSNTTVTGYVSGDAILVSPTTNTTYTLVSVTDAASNLGTGNSGTATITVNPNVNPTFTAVAPICSGTSLSELPTTSINNITGTWSPELNYTNSTTYIFTPTAGQCANTTTMDIVVNTTPPPTASSQILTSIATVSNLVATGSNLQWYDTITGGLSLANSTTLFTGTYYVSQSENGCESARTAVVVTISNLPIVVTPINYCKRDTASPLSAVGANGSILKWYITPTGGTGSLIAPTPSTLYAGTIKYYVTQIVDGFESKRAMITVNITALPTTPEIISGIKDQGPLVGTNLTATYSIASVAEATSYFWTVPEGVTIVDGQGTLNLQVNFSNVLSGAGTIGTLSVQAVNASGCKSTPKTLTLIKSLPATPKALVMTIDNLTTPITSFAKYMGTATELKLTATTVATATSYDWELPEGVNRTDGVGTNTNVPYIYVNFLGVTNANTFTTGTKNVLRIGVKSRNAVGASTTNNAALINPTTSSTARLLTLSAVIPDKVATVIGQITGLCGGNTYTYTITDTALASSYTVTAPTGAEVNFTSTVTFTVTYPIGFVVNSNTTVPNKSLVITSVNGIGTSTYPKILTLSTTMPTITSILGDTTYSSCDQIFSVADIAGAVSYTWIIPAGATIVSGQGTNTVLVNYGSLTGNQNIKVSATNDCGISSAIKNLNLISGSCPAASKQIESSNGLINKITLYPNPVSSLLSIETKNNTVIDNMIIYNFSGKIIFEGKPENNQINVENWATGTYILQTFIGIEKVTSKFIKE